MGKVISIESAAVEEPIDYSALKDIHCEYFERYGSPCAALAITFWYPINANEYWLRPRQDVVSFMVNMLMNETEEATLQGTFHFGDNPLDVETYKKAPENFRKEYLYRLIISLFQELYQMEEIYMTQLDKEFDFIPEFGKDEIVKFINDCDNLYMSL